jgi:hypothetical protein
MGTRRSGPQEGDATMQPFASLIGYFILAGTPAFAQATTPPAAGGDIPWIWIILAVVVVGGGIWWYMNRMRGPRV